MKENWINGMKRKLEGHKMEPPTGLWEDISRQMGLSPEPVRQSATMKRWYWAVAAGILALVGFFAVYHDDNPDSSEPQLQTEAVVVSQPTEQTKYSELSSEPQAAAPLLALAPCPNQEDKLHNPRLTPESETCPPDSAETQRQKPEEPQHTENVTLTDTTPVGNSSQSSNHTFQTSNFKHQTNKWSLGVNASGGLLAASNSVRTGRVYQSSLEGSYISTEEIHPHSQQSFSSYTTTEFVSNHHLPVRFGLSVQYQLNNHLSLFSGINYTYLYSEFSIPLYPNIHYDQKLYYLGIPVGLAWQFWSTSHFRFYLSGGAMVEKCVRADLEAGSISKKPWQWSVNAAAGAEYTFIRQLGVYLEPSLGYYSDDGTSLEHYYKEHPLTPSIEFGLRLHLNDK